MQYSIDADDEFLRVTLSGRDTDEPPSHVCAAVLAESRARNRKRILIELDQKFPLSPTSQYHLVTNLPKIGFTAEERIALVHKTPVRAERQPLHQPARAQPPCDGAQLHRPGASQGMAAR